MARACGKMYQSTSPRVRQIVAAMAAIQRHFQFGLTRNECVDEAVDAMVSLGRRNLTDVERDRIGRFGGAHRGLWGDLMGRRASVVVTLST